MHPVYVMITVKVLAGLGPDPQHHHLGGFLSSCSRQLWPV